MVGYDFGEEFEKEKAVRKKEPLYTVKDNSLCEDLRPGIKLSSYKDSGVTYKTTSDVCVESLGLGKSLTKARSYGGHKHTDFYGRIPGCSNFIC